MTIELNDEQKAAIEDMQSFLAYSDEPFFVLSGSAGTGKTTCIRSLINKVSGKIVFTAPTNKAVGVLRSSLTTTDYSPDCCTIYSLLGLRMEKSGEVKVLSTPDPDALDITAYRVVIVDEAGMINSSVFRYIDAAAGSGVKFIFMGDSAQLPPVGEVSSPIWKIQEGAQLTKVMRHDNQILNLAEKLRGYQLNLFSKLNITSDCDEHGGVIKLPSLAFQAKIVEFAKAGLFSQPGYCKALAWRNITVTDLNHIIRRAIFDSRDTWLVGDRVIAAAPISDLQGNKVANTDDEGTVTDVRVCDHPNYQDFTVYELDVRLDNNDRAIFRVLHERSKTEASNYEAQLLREAKSRPSKMTWGKFWEFKEAFHDVRYGYAITVHRSQGSTYQEVFVDMSDILKNRERLEALKCLYVACTRPKNTLYIS